jgi:hypothetical protein
MFQFLPETLEPIRRAPSAFPVARTGKGPDRRQTNVRKGSKADMEASPSNVRFTPQKQTSIERVGMSALCQKRTSSDLFETGRTYLAGPRRGEPWIGLRDSLVLIGLLSH